ncbi:hypothetical protein J6590_101859, partial [Homalodisca vitripennis]
TEQTAQRRISHPTWPRPDEGGRPPELGRPCDDQIQKHKESVLQRIYPLVSVRVLSPMDATPKFQYAGRDSETEVRFRPIDLECQISVEIVSRGVGTHRCRRRRY